MAGNSKELWECAVREIERRKSRTFASVASYALAVGLLLVLVSFLRAYDSYNKNVLMGVGTHFVAYMPRVTFDKEFRMPDSPPGEGLEAAGVFSEPFSPQLVDNIAALEEVKDASPYILYRIEDRVDKHYFLVGGFDPERSVSVSSTTCAPADLVSGRFLEGGDGNRKTVMVEQNYAIVRNYSVGDRIKILREEFELIGIVNPVTRPARADIYMHIDNAHNLIIKKMPVNLAAGNTINAVLVEAKEAGLQDAAISKILAMDSKFEIYSFGCYRPAVKAIGMTEKTLWFLTILILIAAVLFSMKTQFSSVIERRHDIGILKAIGWSNKAVLKQVLFESIIQALAGGVIGYAAAVVIVYFVPLNIIVGQPESIKANVSVPYFLLAVLFSVAGGIVAGIIPALNAAKKNPAESLRQI